MEGTIGFLAGIAVMLGLAIAAEEMSNTDKENAGYYVYEQQREDRDECEATIPRNKRCVLSTLWLPEAEDMPNEYLHQ